MPEHDRDVEYWHDRTRMVGRLCPAHHPAPGAGPAVLLLHDAFGVSTEMLAVADRLSALGHPVFVADMWGDRCTPQSEGEVGPLIGGLVGDRERWSGRVAAAHRAASEQPELVGRPLVLLGYCFGGSSALEHLREGAAVAGVVAVHPGLDLLTDDWSAPGSARVLVCVGSEDPMATADQRRALEGAMTQAGLDWQVHLYSGTKHAFTSPLADHAAMPDVVAYHPRNTTRAWAAVTTFLGELAEDPTT